MGRGETRIKQTGAVVRNQARMRLNFRSTRMLTALIALLAVLLFLPAATVYYEAAGDSCARCHEIRESRDA
jgi:hypothetical protein